MKYSRRRHHDNAVPLRHCHIQTTPSPLVHPSDSYHSGLVLSWRGKNARGTHTKNHKQQCGRGLHRQIPQLIALQRLQGHPHLHALSKHAYVRICIRALRVEHMSPRQRKNMVPWYRMKRPAEQVRRLTTPHTQHKTPEGRRQAWTNIIPRLVCLPVCVTAPFLLTRHPKSNVKHKQWG